MKYITATSDLADAVYNVLHTTIQSIYPKYYPREVVDFFCSHHSKEHVLEGIVTGNMGVLLDGREIMGTGCYDGNHITGVYVLPHYQKRGCGSQIMDCLEAEILSGYSGRKDITVISILTGNIRHFWDLRICGNGSCRCPMKAARRSSTALDGS